MWDSGPLRTVTIEHGVPDLGALWTGELDRGLTVVNNLAARGRRLGADVFERAAAQVPLDLVGMGARELAPQDLPAFEAPYRFLFNPIRYTSLGMAVCEAMMLGMPVVALATTEHAVAVRDGVCGYASADVDELVERMRELLADRALAARLGEGARAHARERFSLERFASEWTAALEGAAAVTPGPARVRAAPGSVRPLAEARERPAQDPRDLHLRAPELGRDLRLRHVAHEPQVQRVAVALVEQVAQVAQVGDLLGQREALVLRADRVGDGAVAILDPARRGVERRRRVGAAGLERLEHLLEVHAEPLGELLAPWASGPLRR